jgi:hypothetical protein
MSDKCPERCRRAHHSSVQCRAAHIQTKRRDDEPRRRVGRHASSTPIAGKATAPSTQVSASRSHSQHRPHPVSAERHAEHQCTKAAMTTAARIPENWAECAKIPMSRNPTP